MYIVWGSGLYGKVDVVPGLGHVATEFGHLYYAPLIPIKSLFVLDRSIAQNAAVPVPFSAKSMGVAWLRTVLAVTAIISIFPAALMVMDGKPDWYRGFILPVAATVAFAATYWFFRRAGYRRARELAQVIGLNEVGLVQMELTYGQITQQEAEDRLKELIAQAPQPASA